MEQDQGASAKADRAATPSEPSQSSVVSGVAGIPCAFTPGPWDCEVHELSEGISAIVYDARGDAIADHLSEPTAHLIAAAPELYQALGICVAMAERTLKASMNLQGMSPYDIAMAALAKARGQ